MISRIYTILLVEDDPHWQELLQKYLASLSAYNLKITTVSSLADALQECEEKTFDLLITDLWLTTTNPRGGLNLIRALLSINPLLTSVVVSAHPSSENIWTAYKKLNVSYFLSKVGLTKSTFDEAFIKVFNDMEKLSESQIAKDLMMNSFSVSELRDAVFSFNNSQRIKGSFEDITETDTEIIKSDAIIKIIEFYERRKLLKAFIIFLSSQRPGFY